MKMGLRKGNTVKPTKEAMEESVQAAQEADLDTPPFDVNDEEGVIEPEAVTAPRSPEELQEPEAVTAPEVVEERQNYASTQVARQPAKQLSPRPDGSGPMVAGTNAGAIAQELESAGFEGLRLGFGAFPMVALTNAGRFETSDGEDLGDYMHCVLLGSKEKYIYKNDQKGKDEDFFYSFDCQMATNGFPVEELLRVWASKGWKYERKPYLDVQAILVDDDELDVENGDMVILSIPKTSIPRFSGYVWTQQAKGYAPGKFITKVLVGDKVTKVAYPFHPWSFQFVKAI